MKEPTFGARSSEIENLLDRVPVLVPYVSAALGPTSRWSDMKKSEHFVQFYESAEFLADSVSAYVLAGFEAGDSCVLAAREASIAEIEKRLLNAGIDVAEMTRNHRYVVLEGEEALSHFMVDGMPDAKRFAEYMGSLIEQARGTGEVRIFGELVAELVDKKNVAACLRLEELWNELMSRHSITLYCAYPTGAFSEEGGLDAILQACGAHARVIPDESYTTLPNAEDRLRNIAYLQQWNRQLRAELEELEKRISEREGRQQRSDG